MIYTIEALKKIIEPIAKKHKIPAIYLFGSYARGVATEESDIDIALILNQELSGEVRTQFIKWASELDLKYDRIFSIIDIEPMSFR